MNKLFIDKWQELKENGAIGIKFGTEAEKQSIQQILQLGLKLFFIDDIRIKLSGVEDCSNLFELYKYNFKSFIAPMVESEFALKKFIIACKWINKNIENLHLSLNLESIMAYNNICSILESPDIQYIDKINIGKTDLGLSIGKTANDPQILKMTKIMVEKTKEYGKKSGVGGNIDIASINYIIDNINPDEIETRHVIFRTKKIKNPIRSITLALDFEMNLMNYVKTSYDFMINEINQRIDSIKKRTIDLYKQDVYNLVNYAK